MTALTMPLASSRAPLTDIGRTGRTGLIASFAMLGLVLTWANLTPISGAVITPGQASVPGKPRLVQSLDGGMVRRIAVADGDAVTAGQVLMHLDPTLIQAKLDVARGRLVAALALRDRLEAEQAGLAAPVFRDAGLSFPLPDTRRAEDGQRQIFAARADLRSGRQNRLAERVAQLTNQIAGIEAQVIARSEQLALIEDELANVNMLFAKGMTRKSEMLDLQSRRAGLLGEIAGNRAEQARLENAIRDAEIETGQAESGFHEEVATELRATMTEIEELILEIVTLDNQLDRVDIRAPSDGMVHELQVTTEGGVVTPGAVIMQIVPQSGGVEFEMRLAAQELERTHVGQKAQLVFPSLDQRTTPRLEAAVSTISPAAVTDPQTGLNFYRLTLSVPPEELDRLGEVRVLPGMPVEAYLQTGDRSVMSYLLAPLTRQLQMAFREE